jgi:hypothetical protein
MAGSSLAMTGDCRRTTRLRVAASFVCVLRRVGAAAPFVHSDFASCTRLRFDAAIHQVYSIVATRFARHLGRDAFAFQLRIDDLAQPHLIVVLNIGRSNVPSCRAINCVASFTVRSCIRHLLKQLVQRHLPDSSPGQAANVRSLCHRSLK